MRPIKIIKHLVEFQYKNLNFVLKKNSYLNLKKNI